MWALNRLDNGVLDEVLESAEDVGRDVILWRFSEFGGNSEMNFFGCIKVGTAGTEAGSLKANNEKIGSLRLGRYCSKAGGRDIVGDFS
jgi:hypothetical protein